MRSRGTTLIELMMAVILLALLLTALYHTYSGSRKQAQAIMQAHQTNDELQRLFDKMTDDIRESNFVLEGTPPKASMAQSQSLKSENPANYITFHKVSYDFSLEPKNISADQCNYTQLRVTYKLEKTDPAQATGPFILWRETLPFDDRRKPVPAQRARKVMMENLDELIIFRLDEPNLPSNGSVYIRARLAGRGKDSRYDSTLTTCVRERGAEPQ
ncbi:MAG TPA: prepilin-type N-terminal cleavage/methylation domain-containing protein [Candidatus Ozemobacteraceae bacterium]|nr:prepilin-type N-terminal cleavage/methylation domain-containing protein [Candidatus Ozemobacteraceae bacterium]